MTPATTNAPSANAFQLLLPSTTTPVNRGALVAVMDAVIATSSSVGGQLVQDIASCCNYRGEPPCSQYTPISSQQVIPIPVLQSINQFIERTDKPLTLILLPVISRFIPILDPILKIYRHL